jgi:hypothetical protein
VFFATDEYEITGGEGSENGLKEIWASGAILDGNSSGRFFRDYLQGRVENDGLGVLYKVEGIGSDEFGYRYFTGPRRAGATKGRYFQGVPLHQLENPEIQVELREHCHTHIIPRIQKLINGKDETGVTETVGWKGGGGFRYFHFAASLLELDKWGNWVINKEYNAAMLAEAVCKLEGFVYDPSDSIYWQHGHSTERDFIYVTTQNLSQDQLQQLSDEVGEERSLLVLCAAFRGKAERFENLTVKKIPKQVLSRCEWGHDDYSLQVENLPKAPPEPGQQTLFED